MTIPGIKEKTAATILAEIGPDMNPFPSSADLSSWAGVCPGNNRSAGKSKSSHIKRANKFLTAALVEAGWGAARKQGSAFRGQFTRWVKGVGKNKATIAICHSLLRVIYAVLKSGQPYREADTTAVQARQREYKVRYHARLLVQLGADPATVTALVEGMFDDGESVKEEQSRRVQEPGPTHNAVETPVPEGETHPRTAEQQTAEPTREPDPSPSGPTEADRSTQADRTARSSQTTPRAMKRRIARGVLGFRIRTAATTKSEYSNVKEPSDTQPSPARSKRKHATAKPKKRTTSSSPPT